MIRHDCEHLKRVTNNDILEDNKGTLRCDANRAAPDPTAAGISCPADCMAYRPRKMTESHSPITAIRDALLSLIGKS